MTILSEWAHVVLKKEKCRAWFEMTDPFSKDKFCWDCPAIDSKKANRMASAVNRRVEAANKGSIPGKASSMFDIYGDGERLFRLRMSLLLNQYELGEKIGVSAGTISSYERRAANKNNLETLRIDQYMRKHGAFKDAGDTACKAIGEKAQLSPPLKCSKPAPGSKQEDGLIDVFLAKCRVAYLDKTTSADFKPIAKECGLDTVGGIHGAIANRLAATRQILDGSRTPRDEAETFKKAIADYREQKRQEQEDENVVERCKELRSIIFGQAKKMKRMEALVRNLCKELGVDPSILQEPEVLAQP
jgi:transcriptional regulator with XRE-family HTH domain